MCMNPPYSSAGKKQLPYSLRGKLTEIYVPELENEVDLWQIIDRNTKTIGNNQVNALTNMIVELLEKHGGDGIDFVRPRRVFDGFPEIHPRAVRRTGSIRPSTRTTTRPSTRSSASSSAA